MACEHGLKVIECGVCISPRTSGAKPIVKATAVWLRRIGTEAQVLVESDGQWRLAITEHLDGNFSHIAESNGAYRWPRDPVTEDAPEREGCDVLDYGTD